MTLVLALTAILRRLLSPVPIDWISDRSRWASPHRTAMDTAWQTVSHVVRNASAVSDQESLWAHRARSQA